MPAHVGIVGSHADNRRQHDVLGVTARGRIMASETKTNDWHYVRELTWDDAINDLTKNKAAQSFILRLAEAGKLLHWADDNTLSKLVKDDQGKWQKIPLKEVNENSN